ncbi:hypothetical protein N0V95_003718 [Ascochyta clinopodiicola]|nr:hypothetical protein N0V95_003718 [Ascochyta clinopodiicola]
MPTILPRTDTNPHGTVAVIIFIAGAIILVLVIILILLFIKKRRSGGGSKGFAPRLERGDGNAARGVGRYGKLEDDEEGAWSAEMEGAGVSGGLERERKGGFMTSRWDIRVRLCIMDCRIKIRIGEEQSRKIRGRETSRGTRDLHV